MTFTLGDGFVTQMMETGRAEVFFSPEHDDVGGLVDGIRRAVHELGMADDEVDIVAARHGLLVVSGRVLDVGDPPPVVLADEAIPSPLLHFTLPPPPVPPSPAGLRWKVAADGHATLSWLFSGPSVDGTYVWRNTVDPDHLVAIITGSPTSYTTPHPVTQPFVATPDGPEEKGCRFIVAHHNQAGLGLSAATDWLVEP